MSWTDFILPAVVAGGSALLASSTSKDAAKTAAGASDRTADTQLQMFAQNREDLAPWRQAGLRGLAGFENTLGPSFAASPGYEFARGEGIRAIDQAASARGMLNSGARLRELMRYGTGVANQEFGNYQNRLAALAGLGQTATGQTALLGAQTAANVGQAQMMGGQAIAQGQIGATNGIMQGLNQGMALYGLMNQPQWGKVG